MEEEYSVNAEAGLRVEAGEKGLPIPDAAPPSVDPPVPAADGIFRESRRVERGSSRCGEESGSSNDGNIPGRVSDSAASLLVGRLLWSLGVLSCDSSSSALCRQYSAPLCSSGEVDADDKESLRCDVTMSCFVGV